MSTARARAHGDKKTTMSTKRPLEDEMAVPDMKGRARLEDGTAASSVACVVSSKDPKQEGTEAKEPIASPQLARPCASADGSGLPPNVLPLPPGLATDALINLGERLAVGHYPQERDGITVPIMVSGAASGADTLFGLEAAKAGHRVIHVLGPRNQPSGECSRQQPETIHRFTDALLNSATVSTAFQRAGEARFFDEATIAAWRDSRRNFLQVRGAKAVYAVAYRLPPGPQTPKLDVGGGTGYALQMYVDRFEPRGPEPGSDCELFFFDDGAPEWPGCLKDECTHRRWNRWDPAAERWLPLDAAGTAPPSLAGVQLSADKALPRVYAGIGSTRLGVYGQMAVKGLYRAHEELS